MPTSLDNLVPHELRVLPADLVTGEPLRYRIKTDGTPLVYGLGFNEVDDGGVPAHGSGFLAWVWQYTGTPGQTEKDWIRDRAIRASAALGPVGADRVPDRPKPANRP